MAVLGMPPRIKSMTPTASPVRAASQGLPVRLLPINIGDLATMYVLGILAEVLPPLVRVAHGCDATQRMDPSNQRRDAVGEVIAERVCHIDLFERPSLTVARYHSLARFCLFSLGRTRDWLAVFGHTYRFSIDRF